jgi:hypothetical protein
MITTKNKIGRPKIMKKAVRVLVQLDESDYTKLVKQLDVSVAQFFRDAVQEKLTGIYNAKHSNKD